MEGRPLAPLDLKRSTDSHSDRGHVEQKTPTRVVAAVYAVSTQLGIVRLHRGNELYAFGPYAPGAPDIASIRVGDMFLLNIGPRLNKVLEVGPVTSSE